MNVVAFLADSLALWELGATVDAGTAPVIAVIHAGECTVWVEQNRNDEVPWRWFVRWRDADMREERSRPCPSVAGMLNAVRRALNVERGNAVRVVAHAAPSSSEAFLAGAGER
ncbi:MAG TPA: hypothetical protein VGO84_00350 [Burkholderiales bacterium]|nr:hypothetical protein [Burkholderiales bacterium]